MTTTRRPKTSAAKPVTFVYTTRSEADSKARLVSQETGATFHVVAPDCRPFACSTFFVVNDAALAEKKETSEILLLATFTNGYLF